MTTLAKGQKNGGHSAAASSDYCNMSNPAFAKGLGDAGYAWPTGAPGAQIGPMPAGGGATQKGRFGGSSSADTAGTMDETSRRSGNAN